MRIGGEIPVVITVSNPGTGRATGVVLEGVLPEGLAHRAGRELEFDIGSLKPGESRSIDLVLSTTGPGMHRMDVGVRADGQLEEREAVVVEVTAPPSSSPLSCRAVATCNGRPPACSRWPTRAPQPPDRWSSPPSCLQG